MWCRASKVIIAGALAASLTPAVAAAGGKARSTEDVVKEVNQILDKRSGNSEAQAVEKVGRDQAESAARATDRITRPASKSIDKNVEKILED